MPPKREGSNSMSERKKEFRDRSLSQGNLNDYLERKRKREVVREDTQEEEIAKELLNTSKKAPRIPPSESEIRKQETPGMEEIKKMFADIKKEIMEIKEENLEYRKEIEILRKELKEKEDKWEGEKKALEKKINSLERGQEDIERRKRKNNIIIRGWRIEETRKEQMKEKVESFLKEKLQEEVKIKMANKLAREMILVEMENWEEKEKIMKGKSKLRQVEETRKVYIDNDLTKKEREIQRKINLEAKERRKDGVQVKVGYKKIKIGEEEWRWNEEEGLLEKKDFR